MLSYSRVGGCRFPQSESSCPSVAFPLRHSAFQTVWLAFLISNPGELIQSVGAAWLMSSLTSSAGLVALVQASTARPIMLFSLAAGAIADSCDKRAVVLVAQVFTTWSRSCWQDAAILA